MLGTWARGVHVFTCGGMGEEARVMRMVGHICDAACVPPVTRFTHCLKTLRIVMRICRCYALD